MGLLLLSLIAPASGCAPDDFAGHWVLADSTAGPEGEIEAVSHLYLNPDGSVEIGLELDGLPERIIAEGQWSQPERDELEVVLNGGTDVVRGPARLRDGVLAISDAVGSWNYWARSAR